ncbi:helix-turn-helix transcriptional regulator [Flavobacterium notoginsengisoli]|uniref:helix-turn-helix transcriptional regulator n=1 Tax=Flavobacterium notoginsengisoli TaxID=1478199 RepID=UPI003630C201
MVNIDDFVKRLEIILEYYSLNASAFADKIGIQRSSMSHLLSGRNKPSLDFVTKILEVFPEVNLYWILTGEGNFPDHNSKDSKFSTALPLSQNSDQTQFSNLKIKNEKDETEILSELGNKNIDVKDDEIEKIVFFYKNGTFKTYSL